MGQDVSATKGNPLFRIEGRPDEHDAVIRRQGQYARILRSQKCPCNRNGQADLWHDLCKGKGYIYSYQKEIEVVDENPPHGQQCDNVITPRFNPITRVNYVMSLSSQINSAFSQGELKILTHSESEIYIDPSEKLPTPYQPIRVGYNYLHWDKITETIKGNGTRIIELPSTRFDNEIENQFIPNYQQFYADIVKVVSSSHEVSSFYKQFIVFVDGQEPSVGEDFTITYYRSIPHLIAITGLNEKQIRESDTFSDLQSGDIQVSMRVGVDVGEGDRITLLATLKRKSELRKKSNSDREELGEFDVKDLKGFIVDEDDVTYVNNTDYFLDDYNYLTWIGNKPAEGKKYSILYNYYPTYTIYKELPEYTGHENKSWPKKFLAHQYTRLFSKQREDILSSEELETPTSNKNNDYEMDEIDL